MTANQTERRSNFDEVMAEIQSLGEYTPEYHDALAMLLTVMARRQWIIADQLRRSEAATAKRRERTRLRKGDQ